MFSNMTNKFCNTFHLENGLVVHVQIMLMLFIYKIRLPAFGSPSQHTQQLDVTTEYSQTKKWFFPLRWFFFSGRAYSFSKGLYTFNSIHIFHYFRGNKSSPANIELSHSKFVWCCCCCCCFLEFLLLMHTRMPIKYHHSYPFSVSGYVLDIVVGESQMSTLYLVVVLLLPHC